ncbi:tRNA (adenosine(37)-N6)-dimethylallyltransferase MiaA [Notoacmeibacter sp. MSK16QG-6]|uniref:tRNA (adenosine(37)-N6)-dimethylallyltransferase MiaA n=1 Tax=Notoacmeibacter sp. MSK16QG-6 TaxID=2957982 RepID=UPI00209F3E76|nr:tRNA (adenosine(37)-N6)-dimethylallyltransferase MiaA [Notoacmeibacter sp. MSK16QG-6]MCP1199650.1 tRNA (adenosine(37)-N6)-dimethylallyltransferase MiaA [Notoacmeibacter sp. MSK16QG-6]
MNDGKKGHGAATLLAGPTASGKTALAIELAAQSGAAVINADSMQVYDVLDHLTARPKPSELGLAPHYLFGHVSPADAYSTGRWLRDVEKLLTGPLADRPVIIVGGTGLYFRALEGGLSIMPSVPQALRERLRERCEDEGAAALHAELAVCDPAAAKAISPNDAQRVLRALEIFEASGVPLTEHQSRQGDPLVDAERTRRLVLMPNREWLRERIALRFDAMMAGHAVDEVKQLLSMKLDPAVPAMKAIGVSQITAMLDGQIDKDEAIRQSVNATRQYAKRQTTWFRNQLGPKWERLDT